MDNGLADQLYSEDVLTDEERKELLNCEGYLKQNDKFCEIFIIKLKGDENLYRKFHEALLDTDQKHVDNLLEGMVLYKLDILFIENWMEIHTIYNVMCKVMYFRRIFTNVLSIIFVWLYLTRCVANPCVLVRWAVISYYNKNRIVHKEL